MLGVSQLVVVVNKMDLVGYDQAAFEEIRRQYSAFSGQIGVVPASFIPVAGRDGENIATRSSQMGWYRGLTLLETLDEFRARVTPVDRPFRMPVQDVYKFTGGGDARRIVAGTIDSGVLRVGDEVAFYPSGKKSRVRSIEAFNRGEQSDAKAGAATGFTLVEQIYVTRGELATISSAPSPLVPKVDTRLRASVFSLGKRRSFPTRTTS